MWLLLSPPLKSKSSLFTEIVAGLPPIGGRPVVVSALPELTAHRGKLLSRSAGKGTAVHGASFIRQRRIVLETGLLQDESLLRLILVHEMFHFAWPRLSNRSRSEYRGLIQAELARGARGELGDSSARRKQLALDHPRHLNDYICESFCDTAAHLYAGVTGHSCFQLAQRWRKRRAAWFLRTFQR